MANGSSRVGSQFLNRFIAEEDVFDRHEAPHAINLFDLDQKYADVVLPTVEVISMLKQWSEAKAAAEGKVKAASM